jgi:ADP-ribose pyrophosphatase YjhB (NUDIX family)
MNEQDKWPRVGVGMIVYNEQGQILMGKRLSKYGYGTWNNPGGKVEFNEDPMMAAIRETEEETNLWLTQVEFKGYFNDVEVYEENIERHWVTLMFTGLCKRPNDLQNLEPTKHSEWRWFHLDELPHDMWKPMYDFWCENDGMWVFQDTLRESYGARSLGYKNKNSLVYKNNK